MFISSATVLRAQRTWMASGMSLVMIDGESPSSQTVKRVPASAGSKVNRAS